MSFDRIRDPRGIKHEIGHMEADYIYTAGIAGEKFLFALKDEGKLHATRCEKCDITYMPPRIYCDQCFAKLENWLEVPATGTVESFTTTYEDMNGEPLDEPITLAFIKIDNTNGGLIHTLGGVGSEGLKIGMRVEAVLKDQSERVGALTDIDHFKPA
jgi:uncharacterized OB-fold protein